MSAANEPIVALATASGRSAIGIIRISGSDLNPLVAALLKNIPKPRNATLCSIEANGRLIDQCLVLYFVAPRSYTGEDMLEIQTHGNPVLLDSLIQHTCSLGARMARPGEFTERAFLNGKMDLAQAEAVADLIHAASEQAIRAAVRTLKGSFSQAITEIRNQLVLIRVQLESHLDFPTEELDQQHLPELHVALSALAVQLKRMLTQGQQSLVLAEGAHLALVGRPNTGKSSLFNALAGQDLAIVNEQAGTTRDIVQCRLLFNGVALELADTAGLNSHTQDGIELEGMQRGLARAAEADILLWVADMEHPTFDDLPAVQQQEQSGTPVIRLVNKTDLADASWRPPEKAIAVSALTGAGLHQVKEQILTCLGQDPNQSESDTDFLARRRHIEHLRQAADAVDHALVELKAASMELAAEYLREANHALGGIMGDMTSDELLGEIFSRFCIGK
ncbi:MAG: tRNA uridine-5-carboxymethylaminomethyl(34) synthesis GTPase MnmE [Gammaproteobacteria bacterium]